MTTKTVIPMDGSHGETGGAAHTPPVRQSRRQRRWANSHHRPAARLAAELHAQCHGATRRLRRDDERYLVDGDSASGSLTLQDCTIQNNQALGANGTFTGDSGSPALGGGLYVSGGTASLTNQAAIVVGQYDRVGLDHGVAPPSTVD